MVEMFVKEIGINRTDGHAVVLLKEKHGPRVMPIWVGAAEFKAITLAMNETIPIRLQTHDLMLNAIQAVGRRVSRIEITEIVDSAFLAKLCLSGKRNKDIILDCRPSDGIALALRHGAPIIVMPEVLDAAGYADKEPPDDDETGAFKKFVENLMASDFVGKNSNQD